MPQSLQTLLEGLYSSVLEARRFVNAQHLNLFESYFETRTVIDRTTGEKVKAHTPRLIPIATSKGTGDGETWDVINAPILALVKLTHLSVDTLEIEFEAKLTNLSDLPPPAPSASATPPSASPEDRSALRWALDSLLGVTADISIMPKGGGFDSGAAPARVKITFKATEAPEGVHLIQEEMLDYIRQ